MTAIDQRQLVTIETETTDGSQASVNDYCPRVRGGSFASVVFVVMVAWLMLLGYGALWLYNWFSH